MPLSQLGSAPDPQFAAQGEGTGRGTHWWGIASAAALGSAVGLIVILAQLPVAGMDLRVSYIPAAHGDLRYIYNPYWARLLFELLGSVPYQVAYVGLMVASLLALVMAARFAGGRLALVLLTYQFAAILYFGQIDAIVVLGIVCAYVGVEQRRPWLAGIGFAVASIKPQMSGPALLLLWWTFRWSDRLWCLLIPTLVVLASFWRYGWWVPEWINRLWMHGPNRAGSITLWEHVGPAALLLWIPVLMARLPLRDKLTLVLATTALTAPYFQQADLVMLQVFPIGYVAWLGNIGFLFPFLGWSILRWIAILPMIVYARYIWSGWLAHRVAGWR